MVYVVYWRREEVYRATEAEVAKITSTFVCYVDDQSRTVAIL
jgi:hypothetical protein